MPRLFGTIFHFIDRVIANFYEFSLFKSGARVPSRLNENVNEKRAVTYRVHVPVYTLRFTWTIQLRIHQVYRTARLRSRRMFRKKKTKRKKRVSVWVFNFIRENEKRTTCCRHRTLTQILRNMYIYITARGCSSIKT